MKKRFSNKLLLIFSAVLLFGCSIIYACGGGDWFEDWYYGYNSNFTPEAFVEASYAPLFLSGEVFYGIGFDDQHNSRFNTQITSDWEGYLKGSMATSEVRFFLTGTSANDVVALEQYYTQPTENATAIKWGKKFRLKDPKVVAFLRFLYLAQKVETASVKEDYWSYEPVAAKVFTDWNSIAKLERAYAQNTDVFIKNRYWFQLMKAYFYSDNKPKAIAFFEQTSKTAVKNTLYYRALSYCAGIHYQNKKYALSNYLYSIVFDKCPPMRVVAAYSFHPQDQNDWNESLALAKTNPEKAALWAVHGYYKDEINAITNIYALDPASPHLNYLLTRLVHNQENKIQTNYAQRTVTEDKKQQIAQMDPDVLALVQKIAKDTATNKPYLWKIALGYLQTLHGQYANAEATYASVAAKLPNTILATSQLRLLRFVNNLNQITVLNSASEKKIIKDLNWLYQELPNQKIENFRYYNAAQWSKKYLSAVFRNQKNNVMAELFEPTEQFYDSDANLEAMKKFLLKPKWSPLETIAKHIYSVKLTDIYAFQAVKATFADKIPEAIAYMEQTDSAQKAVLLGNPFNGTIKDCHDCEHAARQNRKFTHIDFLRIMQQMQNKISQNQDVYNNSLLLGNAFYNLSYFGNARTFYESNLVGYGSSPTYFRPSIKKRILDGTVSKKYYQKALAAATTKEQKAKCLYLLTKWERNEFYNNSYYFKDTNWWDRYDDKINFLAWNGFQILQKDYADTQYYQEVIAECGYFKTYVAKD
ncbi:hypothetical protein [Flavobacterium crassostreae]|uniref:Uncharacterized protein n=1 Tax=Flavobacterium crassostreae TaxID=1763534 RepID=A0A1B9E5Y0_9FLAO|nr:hypothetical protein [Flavobacterium crassostreae]OCB77347.1 hypothetical protein LPBF_04980 [Flavobacterium crassostreae]